MRFSHRQLRAHREVARTEGLLVAGIALAILLAVGSPSPLVGGAAVLLLALGGAGILLWSRGLVAEYTRDVAAASDPTGRRPENAEVNSSVRPGLSTDGRNARSPHSRRGPVRPLPPAGSVG